MNTIFIMIALTMLLGAPQNDKKSISKNGMTVQWEILQDSLQVSVFAPTQGWVAIGFNERDELTGTHLIMGCVKAGAVLIEDRYIRKPGDHLAMQALGGVDVLTDRSGEATKKGTTLEFRLPLKVQDSFHCPLEAGKSYYLLLAYSESDDFDHHSRMRTSVKIQL